MNWKIQNNKNRRLMFEVRSHWGPPTLCKNNSVMLFFVRFIERNGPNFQPLSAKLNEVKVD